MRTIGRCVCCVAKYGGENKIKIQIAKPYDVYPTTNTAEYFLKSVISCQQNKRNITSKRVTDLPNYINVRLPKSY